MSNILIFPTKADIQRKKDPDIYIVRWHFIHNPDCCGCGSPMDEISAREAASWGNSKCPEIFHYAVKAS